MRTPTNTFHHHHHWIIHIYCFVFFFSCFVWLITFFLFFISRFSFFSRCFPIDWAARGRPLWRLAWWTQPRLAPGSPVGRSPGKDCVRKKFTAAPFCVLLFLISKRWLPKETRIMNENDRVRDGEMVYTSPETNKKTTAIRLDGDAGKKKRSRKNKDPKWTVGNRKIVKEKKEARVIYRRLAVFR